MSSDPSSGFCSAQQVRFADIDRAGIVYYPRFFHFFHCALEDFFLARVGVPYHEVIDRERVGYPTVHVETDFRGPLSHGERFEVLLTALRVGERSVNLRYRILRPGEADPLAEARIVSVTVDMATFRAIPIPPHHRPAFQAIQEPSTGRWAP